MGHQFSRGSKIYAKKLAALKANLDVLLEFMEYFLPDYLVIFLSDHGVVSSLWESELTNHGMASHLNESFLFIFNQAFDGYPFKSDTFIDSFQLSGYLA